MNFKIFKNLKNLTSLFYDIDLNFENNSTKLFGLRKRISMTIPKNSVQEVKI
jgi:hypothetical protein